MWKLNNSFCCKYSLLFFVFSAWVSISIAQNLVVNGNFNQYFRCPSSYSQYNNNIKDLLPGWGTVNKSTPDFFHRCSQNSEVGVPSNFAGNTEPLVGDGYIGLILRVDKDTYPFSLAYSEHITGVLDYPLVRGKTYCLTFYYAFAQNSGIKTSGLGVYFSNDRPMFEDYDDYYNFKPQLMLHNDSLLKSELGWHRLSATYTAAGGEKYITLGNFLPALQSLVEKNNPIMSNDTRFFAYYYIDNVSLVEVVDDECAELSPLLTLVHHPKISQSDSIHVEESVFRAGTTYILSHVYFDFEKSILRPESYNELDKIVDFLKSEPLIHINICGHTDNVGTNTYNNMLSEMRAKSVFEYFYSKGISVSRMKFSGKGSKQPIDENDSESGRQRNRRVEIEFFVPDNSKK
jgi:OmpA-OmpF porin, OOP family